MGTAADTFDLQVINEPTFEAQTIEALSEIVDYGAILLGVPAAWASSKGAGVKIGIIDTGWPDHNDVVGAVASRYPMASPPDSLGHGTHVAGIIGARANDFGIVGIAPESVLYCAGAVPGTWETIALALDQMIDWKVDVINMSFGTSQPPTDDVLRRFDHLLDNGTILVASAGNSRVEGKDTITYPALCQGVIPVAAIDKDAHAAPFSATGSQLSNGFAMPGVHIYSTWLKQAYAYLDGTSMASPHLTGLIALILSKHAIDQGETPIALTGRQRVADVVNHLIFMSKSLGDPLQFGHGFIDASKL